MKTDASIDIRAYDKTGQAIASARRNLEGLGSTARNILGGLGIGLSASALIGFSKSVIEYGGSLTDAAEATQTGIESLQVLRFMAQRAGADVSKMDMALVRATKSGYDASRGLSTTVDALRLLGINVDDYVKLAPERKLELLSRSFVNASDQGMATGAVMDLLGTRNAPKLLEALKSLGTDGFDANAEKARKLGQIMSAETAAAMDEVSDAISEFEKKIKNRFADNKARALNLTPFTRTAKTEIAVVTLELERLRKYRSTLENIKGSRPQGIDKAIHGLSFRLLELQALEEKTSESAIDLGDSFGGAGDKADVLGSKILKLIGGLENMQQMEAGDALSNDAVLKSMEQYEKRLQDARGELSDLAREQQILLDPGSESNILQREIAALKKEIAGLDSESARAAEKQVDLKRKEIELIRLQGREESDAARRREEEEARILRNLGLDSHSSGGDPLAAPGKKLSKSDQRLADRERRLIDQGTDFPKYYDWIDPQNQALYGKRKTGSAMPGAGQPDGAAMPGQHITAIADSVKGSADDSVKALERIAGTFREMAKNFTILSQQVANMR